MCFLVLLWFIVQSLLGWNSFFLWWAVEWNISFAEIIPFTTLKCFTDSECLADLQYQRVRYFQNLVRNPSSIQINSNVIFMLHLCLVWYGWSTLWSLNVIPDWWLVPLLVVTDCCLSLQQYTLIKIDFFCVFAHKLQASLPWFMALCLP